MKINNQELNIAPKTFHFRRKQFSTSQMFIKRDPPRRHKSAGRISNFEQPQLLHYLECVVTLSDIASKIERSGTPLLTLTWLRQVEVAIAQ